MTCVKRKAGGGDGRRERPEEIFGNNNKNNRGGSGNEEMIIMKSKKNGRKNEGRVRGSKEKKWQTWNNVMKKKNGRRITECQKTVKQHG